MLAASVFEGFFEFIAAILAWFYGLVPSYGFAIIALTLTVMVVITPLTLKGTKSMLQMQRLQPELKRLQQEHKGDREALNAAMMAFYKENQINPVSGCVPMFAQAPVFFVLWRVLYGIGERLGGPASGAGHAVGQALVGAPLTRWRLTDQPFKPQHLDRHSEFYRALTHTSKMNFLGMDLSISPSTAFKVGIVASIPFLILMVLLLVSQVIQNRQIQGRNTNKQASTQQQAMMKVLPFLLPVFSFFYPAGVALYYFFQGLCRIGVQAYITRKFYGENGQLAVAGAGAAAGRTGSSAIAATSRPKTAGGNGTGRPPAKTGKSTAPAAKAAAKAPAPRKPGTSARSQAAHKKTAGQPGSGRRSGAPRGGSNQGPRGKR
jgi:YidC/Oxa1 family membrane protein insertase